MDFGDFLGELGGTGKGWRSPLAIIGVVIGVIAGGYLGYETEGILGAMGGVALGALIGWWLGVMLRGLLFFLLLVAMAAAVVFSWEWLTGAA